MPSRWRLGGGYHDGEADRYTPRPISRRTMVPGGLAIAQGSQRAGQVAGPRTIGRRAPARARRRQRHQGARTGRLFRLRADPRQARSGTRGRTALDALRRVGKYDKFVLLDAARLMDRTNSYGSGTDYSEYVEIGTTWRLPEEVLRADRRRHRRGQAQSRRHRRARLHHPGRRPGGDRHAAAACSRATTATRGCRPRKVATVLGAGDSFLSYGQPAKAEEFYTDRADQARGRRRRGADPPRHRAVRPGQVCRGPGDLRQGHRAAQRRWPCSGRVQAVAVKAKGAGLSSPARD